MFTQNTSESYHTELHNYPYSFPHIMYVQYLSDVVRVYSYRLGRLGCHLDTLSLSRTEDHEVEPPMPSGTVSMARRYRARIPPGVFMDCGVRHNEHLIRDASIWSRSTTHYPWLGWQRPFLQHGVQSENQTLAFPRWGRSCNERGGVAAECMTAKHVGDGPRLSLVEKGCQL